MQRKREGATPPRVAPWLFLGMLAFYGLCYQGIGASDAVFHYEQARALVQGGLVLPVDRVDPERPGNRAFAQQGASSEAMYLTLAPGVAVMAAPLCALGMALEDEAPPALMGPDAKTLAKADFTAFERAPSVRFSGLINPLLMALLDLVIFCFALELGASRRRALAVALTVGVGTYLQVYATNLWTQPAAALGLTGALWLAMRYRRNGSLWTALGASVFLAMAVSVRFDTLVWAPWVGGFFLWATLAGPRRRWLKPLVAFGAPVAMMGLALAWWNHYRFGSLWATGSYHQAHSLWADDFLMGWVHNLFSLNQGLLVFAPPLLLAPVGFIALWRRHRPLTIVLLGMTVLQYLFYSSFIFWAEASVWGPRFLLIAVPLLLLPLAALPVSEERPWWARAWWGLAILGGVTNLVGALLPMQPETIEKVHFYFLESEWDTFWASEVAWQARAILEQGPRLWWWEGSVSLAMGLVTIAVGLFSAQCVGRALKVECQHELDFW